MVIPVARTTAFAAGLFALSCDGGDSGNDCPGWNDATTIGTVQGDALDDPSGLVVSPLEQDVLWSHNDAGDEPRLIAITPSGETLRKYLVSNVAMGDWEDLAIAGSTLWIGDLGTDAESPPVLVSVPLPIVGPGDDDDGVLVPDDVLAVSFPGRPDVEAIFYDERSARMVLVSRAKEGATTEVFTVDLADGTAVPLTTLAFGHGVLEGDGEVTGGTATADRFALRTRSSAYVWERGTDDLDDAFESDPCPIAVDGTPGGEAIAFDGEQTVYLLGDGAHAPIVQTSE
jgi:hypothetical protein